MKQEKEKRPTWDVNEISKDMLAEILKEVKGPKILYEISSLVEESPADKKKETSTVWQIKQKKTLTFLQRKIKNPATVLQRKMKLTTHQRLKEIS